MARSRQRRPRRRRRRIGLYIDLLAAHGRGIFMAVASYAHVVGWTLVHRYPWSHGEFDVAVYGPSDLGAMGEIDGLIASCHDRKSEDVVLSLNVPTVNISSVRADPLFPSVLTDNVAVGRMAARHLLERGLRHFAFLQSVPTHWFETRRRAFTDAIREAGYEPHVLVMPPDVTGQARRRTIARWLRRLPLPVGLAVLQDVSALEVQSICRDVGLAIPEQVALLSCDDDPLIERLAEPPISSIRLDLERQGYLAARMLDDLLNGRPIPDKPPVVAPLAVATRVSTDILAIDEPDVRHALRFIREHASEPLTVQDVLAAVPLSRRPLEKRFRRVLGRTILDEIHRIKVERAKQMLIDTKLTVAQIAEACGITSPARFSIIFRAVEGMSPTQFRQRTAGRSET